MEKSRDLIIKFKNTKSFTKEISALIDDVIEDLVYRESDNEIVYLVIELETNISDIFSKESSWDFMLSANWSNFLVNKFNTGLIGLFDDMGYLYNSQNLFKDIILDKISNNKDFFNYIKKVVENELNVRFENNYELLEIYDAGFGVPSIEKDDGCPNLNLKLKLIRD